MYVIKKMIKKVEVNVLTDVTFDMEILLKVIINDAKVKGYKTEKDIIEFINKRKFSTIILSNNQEDFDSLYNDFGSQKEYICYKLGLSPMTDDVKKLLNKILN